MSLLKPTILSLLSLAALLTPPVRAGELGADCQARITAKLAQLQTWAADSVIVKAVKARNENRPAELATLDQDKWKALSILDPLVRGFTRNDAAAVLKTRKSGAVTEAFLSAADGTKVAFLTKPTNWSHAGKPKHDAPMSGRTWQGVEEVDESTGRRQLQVAVPVLEEGKPIGSLVLGLDLDKLKTE